MPKRPKSAGTVVIYPMGSQMFRVAAIIAGDGRLQLPKGRREPHESPEETALRETEEETGLRVRLLSEGYLGCFPYRYSDADMFLAVPINDVPSPQDKAIAVAQWWKPEALHRRFAALGHPADEDVLEAALLGWEQLICGG